MTVPPKMDFFGEFSLFNSVHQLAASFLLAFVQKKMQRDILYRYWCDPPQVDLLQLSSFNVSIVFLGTGLYHWSQFLFLKMQMSVEMARKRRNDIETPATKCGCVTVGALPGG